MSQLLNNFVYNVTNNPVITAASIRKLMLVIFVFSPSEWTLERQAVVFGAIDGLLDLFVRGNTIQLTKIDEKVSEGVAHREMAGTTGTGTGLFPAVVVPVANTPAGTPPVVSTPGLPPTGTPTPLPPQGTGN